MYCICTLTSDLQLVTASVGSTPSQPEKSEVSIPLYIKGVCIVYSHIQVRNEPELSNFRVMYIFYLQAVVSQTSESDSKKSSTSRTHQLESQLARAKKAQENTTKRLDESRRELDEMSERCDSLEEEIVSKDKEIKRFQRELKAEELMREEAAKENMELKIQLEKLRASKKKT